MVNICFITLEYPTNKACGAGIYAWNLTKNMAKLGHNVHVITWGTLSLQKVDRLTVYRTRSYNKWVNLPPLFYQFLYLLSIPLTLAKIKAAHKIDVIHANSQFFSALICFLGHMLLPFLYGIPKFVTVHHLNYDEYLVEEKQLSKRKVFFNARRFANVIESIVLKVADAIITVSNFTSQAMCRLYDVSNKPLFVIPNGVIPPATLPPQAFKHKTTDEIWLLSIGMNEPRKGYPILLEAFKKLSVKYPMVKLILVGKRLRGSPLLQFSGNDKISVYDYVTYEELIELYNSCDIYVSASMLEGFGLTILEAMAAGKPVVATKNGGTPEFVKDKTNGILVKPNDCQALYDALVCLLENRDSWEVIGRANKNYVKSCFKWKTAAETTINAYREVVYA